MPEKVQTTMEETHLADNTLGNLHTPQKNTFFWYLALPKTALVAFL